MYVFWQLCAGAAGELRADGEAGGAAADAGRTGDGDGTAAGGAAALHEQMASADSKTAAAVAIFDTTPTDDAGPPRSGDGTNRPRLLL